MLLPGDLHVVRPKGGSSVSIFSGPRRARAPGSRHGLWMPPSITSTPPPIFSAGSSSLPDLGTLARPRAQPSLLASHPPRDPDHRLQDASLGCLANMFLTRFHKTEKAHVARAQLDAFPQSEHTWATSFQIKTQHTCKIPNWFICRMRIGI